MWLIEYKELIRNLVVADLKVKYSSSILGFGWSILNPLMMMTVLVLVFSNLMKMDLKSSVVFMLCGLTVWRFFANGTTASLWSVIGKAHLVKKIYFPREVLVFSVAVSNMISILLEFTVFFVIMFFLTQTVHLTVLLFPVLLLMEFTLVFGMGLILAVTTAYFRDLTQIWEVLLQAGFFLAPVIYSPDTIPKQYLEYYMLNPMARLLTMYRDILIYGTIPSLYDFAVLGATCAIIFILGYAFFKKNEPRLAELI
jgi:lipopolysaccharide transport system permease protein